MLLLFSGLFVIKESEEINDDIFFIFLIGVKELSNLLGVKELSNLLGVKELSNSNFYLDFILDFKLSISKYLDFAFFILSFRLHFSTFGVSPTISISFMSVLAKRALSILGVSINFCLDIR